MEQDQSSALRRAASKRTCKPMQKSDSVTDCVAKIFYLAQVSGRTFAVVFREDDVLLRAHIVASRTPQDQNRFGSEAAIKDTLQTAGVENLS